MERFLILSDIHGNKEALKVVEKFIEGKNIDRIICLGDTLGYGIDFKWCLRWLDNKNTITIIGNHESMISGKTKSDKCSNIAIKSNKWTKENISLESMEYIKRMKTIYVYKNMLFTHSGDIENFWKYIKDYNDAKNNFKSPRKINFFGHTHRPIIITENKVIELKKSCSINIKKDEEYYINPGSIGQNRGSITGGSFMVLEINDYNEIKIRYYFYKYNAYKTYRKIIKNGMGIEVADYLIREKWRKKLYRSIYKIIG